MISTTRLALGKTGSVSNPGAQRRYSLWVGFKSDRFFHLVWLVLMMATCMHNSSRMDSSTAGVYARMCQGREGGVRILLCRSVPVP